MYVFSALATASISVTSAFAELKTFTLDQSRSGLAIDGNFAGTAFSPQAAGALTTSYTGTIQVDLTAQAITFLAGSVIVAANNGTWQPAANGAAGSAPANYGGTASILFSTAYAAIRNTRCDITNNLATPLVSGAFAATNLNFFFPSSANTTGDYRASGPILNTSGSTNLTGGYPNAAPTNATLAIQGSEYVLSIPVDFSGVVTTTSGDINYHLQGKLVAKAPAPPSPLRITDFSLSGNQATFKIDTTPSQHFTILGSTNFTTWTTNDQFTSSSTNTTRFVTLPAPVSLQRYFRVRKD